MASSRTHTLGVALLLLATTTAAAQTSRGTLSGLISDPTGAVIGGARVELSNISQNTVRSTESNAAGIYRFDAVDPGEYRVTVTLSGFKVFQTSPFPVSAAQVLTQDARLEVGDQATRVEVSADSVQLQVEAPVRGGTVGSLQATQLPNATRNPVSLAFTLPGVSTQVGSPGGRGSFSVNGTRGRSNNFLLDGTENNDISIAGQAFQVTNPDAVAEVSVQTTNFDAEFGRAGGAVVNTITRSGTNDLHGTANYTLESTRFNAISNIQSLNPAVQQRGRPPAGTDQWFSGTVGGPVIKNRTFFFGSYLENRAKSTTTAALQTLSPRGRDTLRRLYPQGANRNVDLYLNLIGNAAAQGNFGVTPLGNGRPDLEIGTFSRNFAQELTTRQPIIKIDHRINERSQLFGRFAYDQNVNPVGGSQRWDGFDTPSRNRFINAVVGHTYVFSPTVTNELRLPYNRITFDLPAAQNPLALSAPDILIRNGSARVGMLSSMPQGRIANNYTVQDTITIVRGRHTLRTGADILQQRARQFAPFAVRGTLLFEPGGGFSSWANYIDDFGGSGGAANRDFGSPVYYPELTRTAAFFTDRWRATEALTLTLGVRYEYFGRPMNSLRTPAYAGLFNVDPVTLRGPYSEPNQVAADVNNFAPSVGIAWSPRMTNGLLGHLLGDKKTVIRTGYQIGYDSFFNNIASNAQSSTPNLIATQVDSVQTTANPRGLGGFLTSIPPVAGPLSPLGAQTLMVGNLRNPYYQKWSFGIQRELPLGTLLDVSYVGTKGTRLFINEDLNPLVPPSLRVRPANTPAGTPLSGRLDDLQGSRTIRTNGGDSNYHGLQTEVRRRYANGVMVTGAYTWSKAIDNASEIFATTVAPLSSLAGIPSVFGGQALERGVSFFHREHRAVMSFVYDLPWMKSQQNLLGRVVGGWQVSGVYTYESGIPYSVTNGADVDGLGGGGSDRPDVNVRGLPRVRAVPNAASPTGFVNPDAGNAAIDPATARFVVRPACNVTANPAGCRAGTLGRNTEFGPTQNVWNVNFLKTVRVNERLRFELRSEMFNLLNRPQYGWTNPSAFAPATPGTILNNAGAAPSGQFMNERLLDGNGRVVRFQLKLLF